jgi:hypothetical protein
MTANEVALDPGRRATTLASVASLGVAAVAGTVGKTIGLRNASGPTLHGFPLVGLRKIVA